MPSIAKEVTTEMLADIKANNEAKQKRKDNKEEANRKAKKNVKLADKPFLLDIPPLLSSQEEIDKITDKMISQGQKPLLIDLSKMFTESHTLKNSVFGNRLFIGVNNGVLKPIDDRLVQTSIAYFEKKTRVRLKEAEQKYIFGNNEIEAFNPFQYFLDENKERKPGMLNQLISSMNIKPQFIGEENSFNVSTDIEVNLVKKWLTGIYNSAIKGEKNDLILALYGKEQGEGKTTLISALMKDKMLENFYSATTIEDTDNFKRQSCYSLLILDDENKSGKKADIEGIKKLSGAEGFTIVDKYEKHPKALKRNASFCICTNEKNILKDPTGNRRFLPIEVDFMDINFIKNDFCVYSFWHEVKELAESKSWKSYLTRDEIVGLQDYFSTFFETSLEGELVETHCVDVDAKQGMNTTELIRALELKNFSVNNKKAFVQALKLKGYDLKNVRHTDGKQRKVWNCFIYASN